MLNDSLTMQSTESRPEMLQDKQVSLSNALQGQKGGGGLIHSLELNRFLLGS